MSRPLFTALSKVASFTLRGATVTFGSTLISCIAACYIEKGAFRIIYAYAPHKFANVECASGITQEELDAVRMHRVVENDEVEQSSSILYNRVLQQAAEQDRLMLHQEKSISSRSQIREDENPTTSKFWKESEDALTALIPNALPRQEVMACAMTG